MVASCSNTGPCSQWMKRTCAPRPKPPLTVSARRIRPPGRSPSSLRPISPPPAVLRWRLHTRCNVTLRLNALLRGLQTMDLAEARQFLATHHCAVLATRRRDGRLQMSPITVGVDAAGRAIISSRETAYKTRHLRRDPRASLCVFMDEFYGPWVQIDGTAEVVSLPAAMEPLVDYYRCIAGEHPAWNDYRRAMERDQRVLLRISIDSAGPDRQG